MAWCSTTNPDTALSCGDQFLCPFFPTMIHRPSLLYLRLSLVFFFFVSAVHCLSLPLLEFLLLLLIPRPILVLRLLVPLLVVQLALVLRPVHEAFCPVLLLRLLLRRFLFLRRHFPRQLQLAL